MALAPRLDLRQSQSLVMTPQLQQAIKLLALSNVELEAFVAEEVEKNPLLEMANGDAGDSALPIEASPDAIAAPITTETTGLDQMMDGGVASDAGLDANFADDTFHHDSGSDMAGMGVDQGIGADRISSDLQSGDMIGGTSGSSGNGDGEAMDFDRFAAPEMGLHDHLRGQAQSLADHEDAVLLPILLFLIDQVDATGYLDADLIDVSNRLGVPLGKIEAALVALQSFDPAGVGARSLSECIALQAKDADRYDPAMACLIDHLDLVAKGALAQLKRICGVDDEDMADMIRELRHYDPKPGLRFGGELAQSVVPDVYISEGRAGWQVEMNSATLPRLLVNRRYAAELGSKSAHAKGAGACKNWISDSLANASWLMKALDQRQRTIIRVASEIVAQQEGFFRNGVAHMRPLTLKQVADVVGLHESTISRVTSNKYLSCARGVFELKYFFSSGIQAADGGDAVSAQAVKSAIKALIDAEDGRAILSDDTLVDLLRAKGFDIARRTVAKYREALGLGSSVQRRRQKALGG
jgi:RNA polymerase sigma-54 factor